MVHTNPEEILHNSGLTRNISLIFLNKYHIKTLIEQNSRLKITKIRRKFPETVEIHISEREGTFIFYSGAGIFEFNNDLELIAGNENIFNTDMPYISTMGINFENSNNNWENIVYYNGEKLKSFIQTVNSLPVTESDLLENVSEVILGQESSLVLRLGRTVIHLPGDLSLEKLRRARYAILYMRQNNIQTSRIDIFDDFVRYRDAAIRRM